MRTIKIFLALLCLWSCTDKIPIAPQLTDDTSWTPTITFESSGYQRFGFLIEAAPSQQITRNIRDLVVEYRLAGNSTFAPLDTASSLRFLATTYLTPGPVLQEGSTYTARLIAVYHNGVRRESNEITFTCPITKGKVIKRIPKPATEPRSFIDGMGFFNGDLFAMAEGRLYRVDTSSGAAELINSFVLPLGDSQIAFYDNQLFIAQQLQGDAGPLVLQSYDLGTRTLGNEISLQIRESGRLGPMAYDGRHLLLTTFTFDPYSQRLHRFDLNTGQQLFATGKLEPELSTFLFKDNALWTVSVPKYFDYRIKSFDPQNLTVQKDLQCPLYAANTLSWDGAHFWCWDFNTTSFAKLEVEGL